MNDKETKLAKVERPAPDSLIGVSHSDAEFFQAFQRTVVELADKVAGHSAKEETARIKARVELAAIEQRRVESDADLLKLQLASGDSSGRRSVYLIALLIVGSFALAFCALFLGKEALASDLIKPLIGLAAGGLGGYGLGFARGAAGRRPRKVSEP